MYQILHYYNWKVEETVTESILHYNNGMLQKISVDNSFGCAVFALRSTMGALLVSG